VKAEQEPCFAGLAFPFCFFRFAAKKKKKERMEILKELKARTVTVTAIGLAVTTILTCYGIAVALGHVPAWLPMISDCAVQAPGFYFVPSISLFFFFFSLTRSLSQTHNASLSLSLAPERYIFRIGIISSAVLLWINSLLMLYYLSSSVVGGRKWSDNLAFYIVSLGCLGLAMVGAINEKENGAVHGGLRFVLFFISISTFFFFVFHKFQPLPLCSSLPISFT
jgi:hypothetical protein